MCGVTNWNNILYVFCYNINKIMKKNLKEWKNDVKVNGPGILLYLRVCLIALRICIKKLQSAKKPYMFIATQSFQSSGGLLPYVHTQHLIIFPHTDKSFFLPDNGQYYYFTIMIVINAR